MKKFLAAALFSMSVMGYLHADDTVVPAPEPVGNQAHAFKALTNADGHLAGQVYEVDSYSKLFVPATGDVKLGNKGSKVAEAKVGPGGVFQLLDVNPGRYSFVINSPQGFATFGQFVDSGANGAQPIGVEIGLVPPQDYAFMREVAMSTPTANIDADGGQVIPENVLAGVEDYGAFGLEGSGHVRGYIVIPGQTEVRAADGMSVWFVQNGKAVASGDTNEMGLFDVTGLSSGWYTMVSSGKYGFLAIEVEIVPVDGVADTIDAAVNGVTSRVWVKAAAAAVSPAATADLGLVRANLPTGVNPVGTTGPLGQMVPSGGATGGGGLGGGFGGLGALLGAAGLGLGAAALADDDKVIIISPPGP
ncbi:MAG: hypothetical protein KDA66_20105 [Planctomycetaceae bacterium]|nr:hypothetical protein [Planctomycetaceae bacterium]